MVVFQFRAGWFTDGRSQPWVVKASRLWVEQFIPEAELRQEFGGHVNWRAPAEPTADMPGEAVGVWGERLVSRFKRVLRERGAVFEVVQGEGPRQHLLSMAMCRMSRRTNRCT